MKAALKRVRVPLIIAGIVVIVLLLFAPKRLTRLFPSGQVVRYDYSIYGQPVFTSDTDIAALRTAMEDTYVVWAGWVTALPGKEPLNTLNLYTKHSGNLPAQELVSVGKDRSLYQLGPVLLGRTWNTRYIVLEGSLFELLTQLEKAGGPSLTG